VRAGIVSVPEASGDGEYSKAQREPGWLASTAAIATARAAFTQCRPRLERRSRWRVRADPPPETISIFGFAGNWGSVG
jgi:hypothetical protein